MPKMNKKWETCAHLEIKTPYQTLKNNCGI